MVPISEIRAMQGENTTFTQDQLDIYMTSIQEHGITKPLLLNENNELIDGRKRYISAHLLGMSHVPVVYEKGTIPYDADDREDTQEFS